VSEDIHCGYKGSWATCRGSDTTITATTVTGRIRLLLLLISNQGVFVRMWGVLEGLCTAQSGLTSAPK